MPGLSATEKIIAHIPKSIKKNGLARFLLKLGYGAGLYRLLNLLPARLGNRAPGKPVLFTDVSSIVQYDHRTGIQRVTKNLYLALAKQANVAPVYATTRKKGWFLAKAATGNGGLYFSKTAEAMRCAAGDVFLALDFSPASILAQLSGLRAMAARNMRLFFLVHDLIPVLHKNYFPPATAPLHASWLKEASGLGGMICVSRAVAGELAEWLENHGHPAPRGGIHWFHHGFNGADFRDNLLDKKITPPKIPYFLLVSTIEPRKGHAEALAAFEKLWSGGAEVGLVFAGKQGWRVEGLCRAIRKHPEQGKKLFWFDSCGDGSLAALYANALCVLMPSHAEGFGLALIEAQAFGAPLFLRDLPVFREVAGDNAFYFQDGAAQMAAALTQWLDAAKTGKLPRKSGAPPTWDAAAAKIIEIMGAMKQ